METNLNNLIHQNERDTPEGTADAVCAVIGLPAKWRDLFFDLLRDECRRNMRAGARRAESSDGHVCPGTQDGPAVGGPSRTAYLSERFATGDGRYVTWGDATIADHLMRVEMLSKLRGGIDVTIQRHQEAIDLLATSGARCLNETDIEVAA